MFRKLRRWYWQWCWRNANYTRYNTMSDWWFQHAEQDLAYYDAKLAKLAKQEEN
jgi:hypothetical protein